jgi:DNA-binding NtrC family response regulator
MYSPHAPSRAQTAPSGGPSVTAPAGLSSVSILVADDEATLRNSCTSVLDHQGYRVISCSSGMEAREVLVRRPFDIALLDWYMSDVPGMELLRTALATNPGVLAIAMTGKPSLDSNLDALRAGAWEYLPKPFSATQLDLLIGRAAHAILAARETHAVQDEMERNNGNSEKLTVLGTSAQFRQAIALARKVARTDAPVFLTGESGSGKELFAQFIHSHSRRAGQEMLAVNCAALPEPLLESEMFGHRRGAFTGAIRDKPGLLETANGSTLLLDELAEMPKPIQAKLLRAIQDGVVRRVGSESPDAVVSVRFVAATNRDPEAAVAAGQLREDLYYRLRVVSIPVPPLRERLEDIPLLATHFLNHYWRKHRGPRDPSPTLSKGALWALRAQRWPGNVRELQNVMEHAVVLLEPGAEVGPEDLPFLTPPSVDADVSPEAELRQPDEGYYPMRDRLLAKFDKLYLSRVVVRAGGNLSKAARLAGIDRTTFYRLMERHGLQRDLLSEERE